MVSGRLIEGAFIIFLVFIILFIIAKSAEHFTKNHLEKEFHRFQIETGLTGKYYYKITPLGEILMVQVKEDNNIYIWREATKEEEKYLKKINQ